MTRTVHTSSVKLQLSVKFKCENCSEERTLKKLKDFSGSSEDGSASAESSMVHHVYNDQHNHFGYIPCSKCGHIQSWMLESYQIHRSQLAMFVISPVFIALYAIMLMNLPDNTDPILKILAVFATPLIALIILSRLSNIIARNTMPKKYKNKFNLLNMPTITYETCNYK